MCAHGLERDQIRSEGTVLNVDDVVKGPHIALLASTYEIVTFEDREKSRESALDGGNWANDSYAWFENFYDPSGDLAATGIVSILAAVHGFDVNKEKEKLNVEHFLNELASGPGHESWTVVNYNDAFQDIPELKELTTTPFMTQIVTEILPRLRDQRSSERGIKSLLVLELGEMAADIAWAFLNDNLNAPSALEPGQKIEVVMEGKDDEEANVLRAHVSAVNADGTYSVDYYEIGTKENSVKKERIVKAAPIMANLRTIQKAIDARTMSGWTKQLNVIALQISTKVKRNGGQSHEECMREGALPEECIEEGTVAKERLVAIVVRGTFRALQRRPTRRSAIYAMFFRYYLDREIRKPRQERWRCSEKIGIRGGGILAAA